MTVAELVFEQIKTLPDDQVHEVLDFIGYLKQKADRAECEWRVLVVEPNFLLIFFITLPDLGTPYETTHIDDSRRTCGHRPACPGGRYPH